jgi:hypothetical protein
MLAYIPQRRSEQGWDEEQPCCNWIVTVSRSTWVTTSTLPVPLGLDGGKVLALSMSKTEALARLVPSDLDKEDVTVSGSNTAAAISAARGRAHLFGSLQGFVTASKSSKVMAVKCDSIAQKASLMAAITLLACPTLGEEAVTVQKAGRHRHKPVSDSVAGP